MRNFNKFQASEIGAGFGVKSQQFRTILVGKDGGIKLNSDKPLDACALFNLIDTMPMRRQEMRAKGYSVTCHQ